MPPPLLQLTVRIPLLLPKTQSLLLSPNREKHLLIEQGNLQFLARIVSRKDYMKKEFRKTLLLLSQMLEDQVQMFITNRTGVNGIAGHSWCSQKQGDPIKCSVNKILQFLTECFNLGFEDSTIAGFRSAISA